MPKITHILCPTDLSDVSTHAIDHAAEIARWSKARITALHVCEPLFMPVPGLPAPDNRVSPEDLRQARLRTNACFRAAIDGGIPVEVIVDIGQPVNQILDRATTSAADLIVMGTHGAGGFEHLVLGSVAEKVLRRAPCPVLTVPPRARATSRLPFSRLLCAVDFSESSLEALQLAVSFAHDSGADLTLLHVIEWPWAEPPSPTMDQLSPEHAAAFADYRRYLDTTATARLASLVPDGVRGQVTTRLRYGKSYVEILHAAAEERADLIVMGVHGRRALDVMLFGSTTNQIVRHATCPVLTLRRPGNL